MSKKHLKEAQLDLIYACLKAVSDGPFFSKGSTWEYSIFGCDIDCIREIVRDWPELNWNSKETHLAINNSLNNLLGYPHGHYDVWDEWIPDAPAAVSEALHRWRRLDPPRSFSDAWRIVQMYVPVFEGRPYIEFTWGWAFPIHTKEFLVHAKEYRRRIVVVNRWDPNQYAYSVYGAQDLDAKLIECVEEHEKGLNPWNSGAICPE